MVKIRAWISAARLRTLPLSVSGILTGSALAYNQGAFNWIIFILAILTTLGFQILSNFANDYGDGVKGTDNVERIGPARALQSGLLSARELRNGIAITSVVTGLLSLLLIYVALGKEHFVLSLVFFALGLSAIAAAIKYTVGKSAYGYNGLGDFFVFLFFGLVAVGGTYFLYTIDLSPIVLLPAVTIGFLSAAVLNLNNMRDRKTDEKVSKNTLAVYLGESGSKRYHFVLIAAAFSSILIYFILSGHWRYSSVSIFIFIPLAMHLKTVFKTDSPALLDPELKKVALSTFFFSVLFILGFLF